MSLHAQRISYARGNEKKKSKLSETIRVETIGKQTKENLVEAKPVYVYIYIII